MRGHVTNYNQTYKIYEILVNRELVHAQGTSDLYIEITPCNGKVNYFVSDDYLSLFDKEKQGSRFTQLVSEFYFGKLISRVPNVA
jgi:copper oxidase (laccase) domain-containing protein